MYDASRATPQRTEQRMRAQEMGRFADNLSRLAGMHAVSHDRLAKLLGLTPQTISMWRAGKRSASAEALLAVGSFFEIDPVALSNQGFAELLPLLAQPERFNRIEAKIKRGELKIV
jgi:transcriptional regulator with XRE-family HTH domain